MAALTEQLTRFEVVGLPVGKAAALTIGMGVGDVVKAFARQWGAPPLVTGVAAAWALMNVKPLKDFLGPSTVELAAAGILADTINDQFNLQGMTSDFLAGLFGKRVVSNSPPVIRQAEAVVAASRPSSAYEGVI